MTVKVHVLHENSDWYAPLAAAFDAGAMPGTVARDGRVMVVGDPER